MLMMWQPTPSPALPIIGPTLPPGTDESIQAANEGRFGAAGVIFALGIATFLIMVMVGFLWYQMRIAAASQNRALIAVVEEIKVDYAKRDTTLVTMVQENTKTFTKADGSLAFLIGEVKELRANRDDATERQLREIRFGMDDVRKYRAEVLELLEELKGLSKGDVK